MNNWSFTGNLGRDAEQRFTQGGESIVSFSVCVKAGFGDKTTTTWANCSMWGKRGEAVRPYLQKGQLVGVSGEVSLHEWQDKDGQKRTNLDVRVNDLSLLGKADRSEKSAPSPTPPNSANKKPSFDDMESDIPF